MELALETLALLFLAAVFAGFVDTLAGGGGLITIPALVIAGVPPLAALGTNKLQGCVGTATASYLLFKRKKIHWAEVRWLMLFAFSGATLGTIAVQFIDAAALSFFIPCTLLIIAGYFLLAPYLKLASDKARLSIQHYQTTVVPLIGVYDGVLGPGTGSFFALAGVSLRGLDLIKATATAKPLNFATNLASLLVFLLAGKIIWSAGLVMMAGQMLGAWLGSHFLFKTKPAVLRLIIVSVCCLMLAHYFTR
jgi:uncharacterized protein